MGAYIYVDSEMIGRMKSVEDSEVNDLLQEALKHEEGLLVEQKNVIRIKPFKSIVEKMFVVYHESNAYDGTPYQARILVSGSGSKEVAVAYLTGIINGSLSAKRKIQKP
jgi:hypothetical protein